MNKTAVAVLFLVLICTSVLYFRGLTPSFSADDYVHLEKNVGFKNLADASKVFVELDGREYRPLVRLSLWANHQMGATALPFHITNLVVHLACTICLYFIFIQLAGSRPFALIGSVLFALHPIHTTNVHFIMGRTGLLCALFFFLTLLAFMTNASKPSAKMYFLSFVLFFLALLSKEEAISLPLLMFFFIWQHPAKQLRKTFPQSALQLAPFFVVMLAYLAIRLFYLADNYDQVAVYTNYSGLHVINNYVKWMVGLAYPFDLYQVRWAIETRQLKQVLVPAVIVCLITSGFVYILWSTRKVLFKNRLIVLGLIWFVLTLLPIVGGNAHRWYLYIPSAGFCLFVASVWRQAPIGLRKTICSVSLVALCICYGLEVYKQSNIWSRQSDISERFIRQAEAMGLHKLDNFHFINMPFGYKSAFLFTFDSFADALAVRQGRRPNIKTITHINLDDNTTVKMDQSANRITFQMEPSAAAYFIFPNLRRTFPSTGTVLSSYPYQIKITSLSRAKTAAAYYLELPPHLDVPIFFFDGENIKEIHTFGGANG